MPGKQVAFNFHQLYPQNQQSSCLKNMVLSYVFQVIENIISLTSHIWLCRPIVLSFWEFPILNPQAAHSSSRECYGDVLAHGEDGERFARSPVKSSFHGNLRYPPQGHRFPKK